MGSACSVLILLSSFLWVRQMIDSWCPSADVSDQGSRPQLADPPPTLTHLYNTYMALIATENTIIASIAEKTFYWVTFAQEPLPAQDIAFAITLGLSEADEETVRPIDGPKLAQYCISIVHFQKPDRLSYLSPYYYGISVSTFRQQSCSYVPCQDLYEIAYDHGRSKRSKRYG